LLNNDAIVEPAWLAELVAFMQLRPEVGMCTSKLLSYYDRRVIDNVGHVVYADGLTRGRGRLECDTGQYDEPAEVFSFSGCAALLRRTMLDDVGFFDEEFFAYCEDADLGWRARLRGWTCWYVPTAVAYHKFSASSEAFSPFKALHVERNRLWLAVKNLPWWLLIASPWWTAQRYWWQAYGALRGQGASGQFVRRRSRWQLIRLLLQAYLSAAQGLGRVIGQRRQIQRRQLVDRSEIDRWLNDYGVTARHIGLLE
jgi:GT2 family glycosyltransferase